MCVDDPPVLFRRKLRFHGSVTKLRQDEISAKASVIEAHCFGTVTIKQKERRATQHRKVSRKVPVYFSRSSSDRLRVYTMPQFATRKPPCGRRLPSIKLGDEHAAAKVFTANP